MTKAKAVMSPTSPEDKDEKNIRDSSPELRKEDASKYRGLAARLNYLALDRTDLQFAAKQVAKNMSCPRQHDWEKLKRVARYLVGAPRMIQKFVWQEPQTDVITHTDSDWAGDKSTRKSTSGGVMMMGMHMIKSWSSTQQVLALSSGEAELYALLKGASQMKGLMSQLAEWGITAKGIAKTDASAAMGMAHRQGLGRTRHIDVQYLWIQDELKQEKLQMKKVKTDENPADMFTKGLKPEVVESYMQEMGCKTSQERAKSALRIEAVSKRKRKPEEPVE